MLLLAAVINGDQMNLFNVVGLIVCLVGIVLHVFFKTFQRKFTKSSSNFSSSIFSAFSQIL